MAETLVWLLVLKSNLENSPARKKVINSMPLPVGGNDFRQYLEPQHVPNVAFEDKGKQVWSGKY